jgi:hypothetical protein
MLIMFVFLQIFNENAYRKFHKSTSTEALTLEAVPALMEMPHICPAKPAVEFQERQREHYFAC